MALDDPLDLPRPFGPYTLLRRLAVGGMAEVYVAKQQGIGGFEKLLAIKVIHPRFSEDEHFVQMLVEEAKITSNLNHANIAQTYNLDCINGVYSIAMELVEGADAYRVMRKAAELKRALPIDVCAHIVSDICNALDYAHRKRDASGRPLQIIHRDVSPQNVLISFAGEVKLVDFGIAKAALRSAQTEVGVIKGKYYYMSPEQAWGDELDARTDVFSAGVVLYELLTGRMLHTDDNIPKLLDKVRKAEIPPPETRRPSIPKALSDIVMKAVALKREDRWSSGQEMSQALTQWIYTNEPTFRASRVAEMMSALFPDELARTSTVLKLPSIEDPPPAKTTESRRPVVDSSEVSSDGSLRPEVSTAGKGGVPERAPGLVRPPGAPPERPTLRPPRAPGGKDGEATRELKSGVTVPKPAPLSVSRVDDVTEDHDADEWDADPTKLKSQDEWEDDATLVDSAMGEALEKALSEAPPKRSEGVLVHLKPASRATAPTPVQGVRRPGRTLLGPGASKGPETPPPVVPVPMLETPMPIAASLPPLIANGATPPLGPGPRSSAASMPPRASATPSPAATASFTPPRPAAVVASDPRARTLALAIGALIGFALLVALGFAVTLALFS